MLCMYTFQFFLEELQNCYKPKASGTYNANLKTLTLFLEPTNQYQCLVYGNAAVFTVAAFALNKDIVWVVEKFNYSANSTIVLQNIDFMGTQPQLVEINISSYTHFTIVQLLSLNYQLSALDQCFKAGTSYQLTATQMELTVVSSGACQLQMFNLKEIQIVMGDFSTQLIFNAQTTVHLDGVQVLGFDANGNFQNYIKDKEIKFSMSGDYVSVMQSPFLSVQLTFLMKVDLLTVQSIVIPDQFIIGYNGQLLQRQGAYIMENEITVRYQFTDQVINDYSAIIQNANQFIFRISMRIGGTSYTIQQMFTQLDINRQLIIFKCNQDNTCLKNLQTAMTENLILQFDVTILTDLQFQQLFVSFIQPYSSCWENGVALLSNSGVCIHLIKNSLKCVFDQTIPSNVVLSVRNASDPILYQYSFNKQMDININTIRYCFDCSDQDCNNNISSVRTDSDISFLFNATYSEGWVAAPVVRYAENDYKKQNNVATIFGTLFITVSIVLALIKIFQFKNQISMMKKKRK
ncbi:Conserved_hypothetical protein [Hexamita inflata]|uniref:Transmembrane protein n=1 Tax=Hexamita inflata TaxID=28002 RepID=A0AA86V500_9EUKA|nr:Conserved hypothetical protein [Hexamita inflata]